MPVFDGELGLQFVTHLANHYTVPDLVRLARLAADKGFKQIWVNDNIRYRSQLVVMLCIVIRERLGCLRNSYQPALPFSCGLLGLFSRQACLERSRKDTKLAKKFLLTGENRGNKVFDLSLLSPLPPAKQSILIFRLRPWRALRLCGRSFRFYLWLSLALCRRLQRLAIAAPQHATR